MALDEPYKIEVDCEGEKVVGASLKVGFNFRGLEWLAQRKNVVKCIALLERGCGICSNVHCMTFCVALERIGSIEVPPRAQYVRAAHSSRPRSVLFLHRSLRLKPVKKIHHRGHREHGGASPGSSLWTL
jgi:Ni,Fe-hydrogenase III large subunit